MPSAPPHLLSWRKSAPTSLSTALLLRPHLSRYIQNANELVPCLKDLSLVRIEPDRVHTLSESTDQLLVVLGRVLRKAKQEDMQVVWCLSKVVHVGTWQEGISCGRTMEMRAVGRDMLFRWLFGKPDLHTIPGFMSDLTCVLIELSDIQSPRTSFKVTLRLLQSQIRTPDQLIHANTILHLLHMDEAFGLFAVVRGWAKDAGGWEAVRLEARSPEEWAAVELWDELELQSGTDPCRIYTTLAPLINVFPLQTDTRQGFYIDPSTFGIVLNDGFRPLGPTSQLAKVRVTKGGHGRCGLNGWSVEDGVLFEGMAIMGEAEKVRIAIGRGSGCIVEAVDMTELAERLMAKLSMRS